MSSKPESELKTAADKVTAPTTSADPAGTQTTKPETSHTSSKAEHREALIENIKSLQFAWFSGHVLTLVNVTLYTFTYLKLFKSLYKFWYFWALFGVIGSFGILNYQLFQKDSNVKVVLKDDNFQYFLLGVFLLILRPYVYLTLVPFALFSLFHVLVYANTYLLPIAGLEKSSISHQISEFVTHNNTKSIQLASVVEIYAYVFLFLRLLTFRKRSLVPFIIYTIFIKARYESLIFTRNYFKSLELQVEDLINKHAAHIPAVKQGWVSFKNVVRSIGNFKLVNDYTKEKST